MNEVKSLHARHDARSNPFICVRPLMEPSLFVGRRQEITEVFDRLEHLDSISVVSEQGLGKTSLLRCVSHPDTIRRAGHDPDKYLFVFVDLQGYSRQDTPGNFWKDVLDGIRVQVSDDGIRAQLRQIESPGAEDLGSLFDRIARQGRRTALLLDEFDNAVSNPNFGVEFFNSLRFLATNHGLALITSSSSDLAERCHSQSLRCSPFFNILTYINLGPFSRAEARELIDRGCEMAGLSFTAGERQRILALAGHHPLFLQMACYALFEGYTENLSGARRRERLIEVVRQNAEPHFAYHWYRITEREQMILFVLALLGIHESSQAPKPEMERVVDRFPGAVWTLKQLEKRGIVSRGRRHYVLFSELFGEWILNRLFERTNKRDEDFEAWLRGVKEQQSSLGQQLQLLDAKAISALAKLKPEGRQLLARWVPPEAADTVVNSVCFTSTTFFSG